MSEMNAKEKLLLMIDTLSENYAIKVLDFVKGLKAGETMTELKESETNKLTKTSAQFQRLPVKT